MTRWEAEQARLAGAMPEVRAARAADDERRRLRREGERRATLTDAALRALGAYERDDSWENRAAWLRARRAARAA